MRWAKKKWDGQRDDQGRQEYEKMMHKAKEEVAKTMDEARRLGNEVWTYMKAFTVKGGQG